MAPCQILTVLHLGLLLQFCNCSRQIRAAAEHQSITSGHRLLHDTYMPPGAPLANHDEMAGSKKQSITRFSDELAEKNSTTELPLSVKKKQKQLNMKLKGASKLQNDLSNWSSKKSMAVPWHKPPPYNFDHGPTFHVDYSAPKTHPPKNN